MRTSRLYLAYVLILACFPIAALAAMESSLYKIRSDTINIGGVESESSTYILGDTLGEQATGDSNSSSYNMHAGFWQMQESYIAITSGADVTLPNINGLSGGAASGSTYWIVTTDNDAGYSLSIKASTSPALKSSNDSFADYTPASVPTPDFAFSVPASDSEFGFTPEGNDILAKYKDNGSICNTGSSDTDDACWDSLSTTDKIISQSTSSNQPIGATTTITFRAESGASHIQTNGSYTATMTVTALTL